MQPQCPGPREAPQERLEAQGQTAPNRQQRSRNVPLAADNEEGKAKDRVIYCRLYRVNKKKEHTWLVEENERLHACLAKLANQVQSLLNENKRLRDQIDELRRCASENTRLQYTAIEQ